MLLRPPACAAWSSGAHCIRGREPFGSIAVAPGSARSLLLFVAYLKTTCTINTTTESQVVRYRTVGDHIVSNPNPVNGVPATPNRVHFRACSRRVDPSPPPPPTPCPAPAPVARPPSPPAPTGRPQHQEYDLKCSSSDTDSQAVSVLVPSFAAAITTAHFPASRRHPKERIVSRTPSLGALNTKNLRRWFDHNASFSGSSASATTTSSTMRSRFARSLVRSCPTTSRPRHTLLRPSSLRRGAT